MTLPVFKDVVGAASRLRGVTRGTPLIRNDELDRATSRRVFVKCEPLQVTGSFKLRGAYNRLSQLSDDEKKVGVVAFSSGNHAQGVARAARLLGMPATIVMPADTPNVKIDGVRRDGADIIFYDRQSEDREAIAEGFSARTGAIVVPSYDDPHIIAGQGTCGLEIVRQMEEPAGSLICCVGGGGLIAGVSLAIHNDWPDTRIIGAEPEDFDDYARSLASGQRETILPGRKSICDALLSPSPGELTFAINRQHLHSIAGISDEDAKAAMRFAFRHLKIVVEPGGAAALAALLSGKADLAPEGPVVVVMTGGNVDPQMMSDILAG